MWIGLLAVAGLLGCASVSIVDEKKLPPVAKRRPKTVYVQDFSLKKAKFRVDRTGKELREFKKELQTYLSEAMVERVGKYVTGAKRLKRGESLPQSGWLVRGKFLKVSQGSRFMRAVIGFGAGGTKMETKVQVVDLSRGSQPVFMKFRTTGGTNAEPGAILNADPISAGAFLVIQSLGGLTTDADRTARMITANISEYFQDRKWSLRGRELSPKVGTVSPPPPNRPQPPLRDVRTSTKAG